MKILSELKKQRDHIIKEVEREKHKIEQVQEWIELEEVKIHELNIIINHFEGESDG